MSELSREDLIASLRTIQRLVDMPAERILNETERVRRIKLVVDTTLAGVER